MEKEVKKDENEKNDEQVILKKENKKKDTKTSKKQHDNNLSLDDKVSKDDKIIDKVEESFNETPDNTKEKRCIKCNNLLSSNDKFCFICGTEQTTGKSVNSSKKSSKNTNNKINKSILSVVVIIVVLLLGLWVTLFIVNYIDNTEDNVDTSNKNVTIDDTGIADAVEKVYDSVVVVENYVNGSLYATGSGFVYKTDKNYGYILTNSHVITNATSIKLGFTNDKKADAEVVGVDEYSDIAVLKVAKKYIIQVAEIGNNNKMRVGDTTFAVGTPLDAKAYSWSVTRGILSGKDRVVSSGSSYMTVLQTDTPINSGNSGGPLCNANGEVIGITNMKLASDQIEGMGFAIPIETATSYADGFIKGDDVRRPYIGVSIYDGSTSFFGGDTKVVIESVEKGSPASDAGMKAGDIITEIDGEPVENSSYFKYKLYNHKIGDKVKIKIERDGKDKTFTVKLESNAKTA